MTVRVLIKVYSHFGRLRRPMLALWVCIKHSILCFGQTVLYTNLHSAILNISHRGILNMLHRGFYSVTQRNTFLFGKKSLHANFFFNSAFSGLQIILLALPCRKDSKNVLRFEIGPWEGGEKIGQTHKQTDKQTDFREL